MSSLFFKFQQKKEKREFIFLRSKEKTAHPESGDILKLITIHELLDEAESLVVLLLLLQAVPVRSRAILGQHLKS